MDYVGVVVAGEPVGIPPGTALPAIPGPVEEVIFR